MAGFGSIPALFKAAGEDTPTRGVFDASSPLLGLEPPKRSGELFGWYTGSEGGFGRYEPGCPGAAVIPRAKPVNVFLALLSSPFVLFSAPPQSKLYCIVLI